MNEHKLFFFITEIKKGFVWHKFTSMTPYIFKIIKAKAKHLTDNRFNVNQNNLIIVPGRL